MSTHQVTPVYATVGDLPQYNRGVYHVDPKQQLVSIAHHVHENEPISLKRSAEDDHLPTKKKPRGIIYIMDTESEESDAAVEGVHSMMVPFEPHPPEAVVNPPEEEAPVGATFADETVAEAPADETVAEAPENETVAEAPSDEAVAEAPSDEAVAEAPVEDTIAKTPSEDPIAKTPSDETVSEAPVGEAVSEAPEEETVAKTPADETVAEAPSDEAVAAPQSVLAETKNVNAVLPDAVFLYDGEFHIISKTVVDLAPTCGKLDRRRLQKFLQRHPNRIKDTRTTEYAVPLKNLGILLRLRNRLILAASVDKVLMEVSMDKPTVKDTEMKGFMDEPTVKDTATEVSMDEPTVKNTEMEGSMDEPTVKNTEMEGSMDEPTVKNTATETITKPLAPMYETDDEYEMFESAVDLTIHLPAERPDENAAVAARRIPDKDVKAKRRNDERPDGDVSEKARRIPDEEAESNRIYKLNRFTERGTKPMWCREIEPDSMGRYHVTTVDKLTEIVALCNKKGIHQKHFLNALNTTRAVCWVPPAYIVEDQEIYRKAIEENQRNYKLRAADMARVGIQMDAYKFVPPEPTDGQPDTTDDHESIMTEPIHIPTMADAEDEEETAILLEIAALNRRIRLEQLKSEVALLRKKLKDEVAARLNIECS